MRSRWRIVMAMLIPAMLLGWASTALGQDAASPEATPAEPPPTVFVRTDPALGPILTDPNGMTLYLFTNDTTPGESTCYDDCAAAWPPFSASEPLALPNGVEGELTLITRTDGTSQVAYNGIPLYYWASDTQPGMTTGQGVGDVWFVVPPGAQMGAVASPVAVPAGVGTPVSGGEVTVTLTEFTIEASATDFTVGQEYTFTVTNAGGFPHEFYIEPAGANGAPLEANGEEAEIEPMDPGSSGSLTWTFTEPGIYQFACHVRSHYPQGMAVTITVTE